MRYVLYMIIFIGLSLNTYSYSEYVNQIPNGTVVSCNGCHVNGVTSGLFNDFSKDVETGFIFGDTIDWNAALADLDSDQDGVKNGEELLDPDGTWDIGDPNPGDPDDVTNPGIADNVGIEEAGEFTPIINISPNPVTESINLEIQIVNAGEVEIDLLDLSGKQVIKIFDGMINEKIFTLAFDINQANKYVITNGIYFLRIKNKDAVRIKKVIISK